MTSKITINLNKPHVTIESYSELTGLTPVKRKWMCFRVAAACHLEPGCACSNGISAYRRMTNGVNGTDSSEK